jgi:hypothetical protein
MAALQHHLTAARQTAELGQPLAVLTLTENWSELCVMHGDAVLFARSLAAGGALPGEVRRNLAVYGGQWPQHPLRALYIADGGEHAELIQRLQQLLTVPIVSFDPLASMNGHELPPAPRGAFAAPVGLLRAKAQRKPLAINFVAPREPRPQTDPNKRRLVLAGSLAAAVLIAVIGYCFVQINRKDRELAAKTAEKLTLDGELTLVDDDAKRIKALDEWAGTEVVWLDVLYDLTDIVPDPEQLRLVQLVGNPLAQAGKGKNVPKHVARLAIKGITGDDYQGVESFMGELVQDRHYRVDPKELKRNTGAERLRFRQEFSTKVDIEPRPPNEYVRRLPPVSAEKKRRQDSAGGMDFGFGGFGGQP